MNLDQKQLAERWGIATSTLERWRSNNIGPSYMKLEGVVLYRLQDVEAYEAANIVETKKKGVK